MGKGLPTKAVRTIRNALGPTVYYVSYGQQLTRTRVVPLNTATPARTRVRNFMRDVATIWRDDLDQYERAEWIAAAKHAPRNPQRNERGPLSGWQFFHQVNIALENIGVGTILNPPPTQPLDRITSLTVDTLDATTQTITLDYTGATGPDSHICIYATGNRLTSQFSANGTTRFVQSFPPGTPPPLDISAAWTSKFGTLQANRRVNFQACTCNGIDGRLSKRAYATASATGQPDAMQFISEVVLTAASPTISFSSIPQTFRHLLLFTHLRSAGTGIHGADNCSITLNSDTGANYDYILNFKGGYNTTNVQSLKTPPSIIPHPDNTADANRYGAGQLIFVDYTATQFFKDAFTNSNNFPLPASIGYDWLSQVNLKYRSLSPITSIVLTEGSASGFAIGSRASLYGIS